MTTPTGLLNSAQSTYMDFIRATAAILVLLGHSSILFLNGSYFSRMDIQAIGVLAFFLMSGFLISYSVFRKYDDPGYTFKHFFIDRFSRIYCAFIPALLLVFIVDTMTFSLPMATQENLVNMPWHIPTMMDRFNYHTLFGNLLMLQDFPVFQIALRLGLIDESSFIKPYSSGSLFWTIAIEWWIYMLFGVVTISIIRNKKPITLLFLCILGFISIEPFYFLVGGVNNCLTFLWVIGMLVSLIFINMPKILETYKMNFSNKRWKWIYVGIFFASLILMAGRAASIKFDQGSFILTELQFSIFLSLGIFSLLFFFGEFTTTSKFLKKAVGFVADYSYSLYLTHAPLLTYLYVAYPGHDYDVSFFWIGVILSNVLAIIFWWLFERHHRRLGSWMKARINKTNIV